MLEWHLVMKFLLFILLQMLLGKWNRCVYICNVYRYGYVSRYMEGTHTGIFMSKENIF